jgi:hypothetical protein
MIRAASLRLFSSANSIRRGLAITCAITAVLVALGGLRVGYGFGFDRWIPENIDSANLKIAAAISDLVYHTNRGYLADARVYEALRQAGMTSDPAILSQLGQPSPPNFANFELFNRALHHAATLGPLSEASTKELKPMGPDGFGMIDLYRIAFALFGIEVKSLFKFYCVLEIVSIMLFVMAYWRRLEAMVILLIVAWGQVLVEIWLGEVSPVDFQATHPPNYFSIIGVVSALHVTLSVVQPGPLRPLSVLALIGQTIILMFVVTFRASAWWQVIWPASFVLGFLIAGLVRVLKPAHSQFRAQPTELIHRSLSWSALVFAGTALITSTIYDARQNAIYRISDEFLPQGTFWHNAFVGLSIHPDWKNLHPEDFVNEKGERQTSDALPVAAAKQFLQDNYGISSSYLTSSPLSTLRYRTTERVIEEAYLDFILHHKMFALELHLIYKPLQMLHNFASTNVAILYAFSTSTRALISATALGIIVLCAVIVGWIVRASFGQLAVVLLVGSAWSLLPSLLTIPSQDLASDQVIMIDATILVLVFLLITKLADWRRGRITYLRDVAAADNQLMLSPDIGEPTSPRSTVSVDGEPHAGNIATHGA